MLMFFHFKKIIQVEIKNIYIRINLLKSIKKTQKEEKVFNEYIKNIFISINKDL